MTLTIDFTNPAHVLLLCLGYFLLSGLAFCVGDERSSGPVIGVQFLLWAIATLVSTYAIFELICRSL
jgi:hypothetical protein